MMRNGFFLLLLILGMGTSSFAQKVKYKDLLILLNAKQYEQAEPFLKRYLKDTDDNVSAYLFMGIIYQEKSSKNDILKETEVLTVNIDSAIFFYEKTLPKLTEKEIKKNDENYVMYTRRDLRTGEFGVKLSDIQLDLESRIRTLKERKQNVLSLNKAFDESNKLYDNSQSLFNLISEKYNGEKEFLLQSDDKLLKELNNLSVTFDSCQNSFKSYKELLALVGKTSYNQNITLQEIKDFKKDGKTLVDFYINEISMWDYSQWCKQVTIKIKDEIIPLRKEVLKFDNSLNKLRERIRQDSVIITNELKEASQNPVFSSLNKFDDNPMPSDIYRVKLKELEYANKLAYQKSIAGDLDPSNKINVIKQEINLLGQLDSISEIVNKRNWEEDQLNYKDYVTGAYGTISVLKSLIKSTNEFSKREAIRKMKELETATRQLKWLIVDSDSIPLFKDVPERFVFRPLIISNEFTSGIRLTDSTALGYFYGITPARTSDLKISFSVDTASVKSRNLPLIKALSLTGNDQQYFVLIYSEGKIDGKFPITITKINRKSGLDWSNQFAFDYTPVELKLSAASGELSIRTTSTDGDNKMVVIDSKGVRQQ